MGRRSLAVSAAACVAAGIALWCSRASLDVVQIGPRTSRVAMLPSWPDLIGGTCLVLLLALLGLLATRRVSRRGVFGVRPPDRIPPDLLAPLFALLALLLPFLPVVSDSVPVWRAFAGPAGTGLWAIVLASIAWLAWDARQQPSTRRPTHAASSRRTLLVFGISLAIFGAAATRLTGTAFSPGGDEPHYLVITQSLLTDGDLRIENNHARGDYRDYYRGRLKPDYLRRGRDGEIYSIHPIGLPLLILPVFAIAGYTGVVWLLVVSAAVTATLVWRAAARWSDAREPAAIGWIAVAASTPIVLQSFAVYPEMTAAGCTVLALCWTRGEDDPRTWTWAIRGGAVALLPWLSAKYAPLSIVLACALALRAGRVSGRARAFALLPYIASVSGWLLFFQLIWGSFSPASPYGPAHHMALTHLLLGAPALFLDQEYGILPYAPVLLAALPGFVCLWRDGGSARRLAIEIGFAVSALVGSVGAYAMWWGGSSAPGRQIAAVLPLLAIPVARWAHAVADAPVRRALLRVLVLMTVAITAAIVGVRGGLLAANSRDGVSQFLEWLSPTRDLVRVVPSAIAFRDNVTTFAGMTLVWAATIAAAAWIAGRWRTTSAGWAMLCALLLVVATITGGSVAVSAAFGSRLLPVVPPGARVSAPMLQEFDARRRPIATVFDPLRRIDIADVPALFAMEGAPGLRRPSQPLPVLLNTRLALPAGRYRVVMTPRPDTALSGTIGLQVGRIGTPVLQWAIEQHTPAVWSESFPLGVDAAFVGFRGSAAFEAGLARLEVLPESVVNASDRPDLPSVVSAGRYRDLSVYFHGEEAYPEANGFWVRGHSTLLATFVPDVPRPTNRGVLLKMHGGNTPVQVDLATDTWRTTVVLPGGESREVLVPARPRARLLSVRISPASGFVPAEQDGGNDRRLLGCWVEVLE
jgi:hypothetical protein